MTFEPGMVIEAEDGAKRWWRAVVTGSNEYKVSIRWCDGLECGDDALVRRQDVREYPSPMPLTERKRPVGRPPKAVTA